ncbi:MAG: LysE family translocator [Deltaproteobacteria bacterium]|nr:LysE family translocator [Deltaproteobacteria bacterium]
MRLDLFIEGILIGFVVAVPVGPLGLLCINRALMLGPLCGLFSGFGVATADALAAGIAALGITLISGFLIDHQFLLRLIGGFFLLYLGIKIYRTPPKIEPPPSGVNGLLSAYVTTFFLTVTNPVTILSFIAIYAGWQVQSLHGNYPGAAVLTFGVFIGSSLWWVALYLGLTAFRERFSLEMLGWVHKVSGVVIAAFGLVVLLSVPVKQLMGAGF